MLLAVTDGNQLFKWRVVCMLVAVTDGNELLLSLIHISEPTRLA